MQAWLEQYKGITVVHNSKHKTQIILTTHYSVANYADINIYISNIFPVDCLTSVTMKAIWRGDR